MMLHSRYCPFAFLGVLVGIAACQSEDATPAPNEASLIEFRLVEDVPSEGSQEAMLNGERLNLDPTPVVSDADVQTIATAVESGRLLLSIQLTEKGREQLRRATAVHIGGRMAVLFDSQVRSAPVIRDSISGGLVQVPIDVTPTEVDSLVAMIRARWQEPTGGPKP